MLPLYLISVSAFLGSANPKPEFNALLDVEAYYIVAKAATADKVTMVPFSELLRTMPITVVSRN
jgi:hypothetical protein